LASHSSHWAAVKLLLMPRSSTPWFWCQQIEHDHSVELPYIEKNCGRYMDSHYSICLGGVRGIQIIPVDDKTDAYLDHPFDVVGHLVANIQLSIVTGYLAND
jgi:hypothetical protein